jgi:hypothetical protein
MVQFHPVASRADRIVFDGQLIVSFLITRAFAVFNVQLSNDQRRATALTGRIPRLTPSGQGN